jgi:hypothetical protein
MFNNAPRGSLSAGNAAPAQWQKTHGDRGSELADLRYSGPDAEHAPVARCGAHRAVPFQMRSCDARPGRPSRIFRTSTRASVCREVCRQIGRVFDIGWAMIGGGRSSSGPHDFYSAPTDKFGAGYRRARVPIALCSAIPKHSRLSGNFNSEVSTALVISM